MDYTYLGKNLDECLDQAEKDLSILKSQINYDIIKEEKGFLKKKCEIIIHVLDTNKKELVKEEAYITPEEDIIQIEEKEEKIQTEEKEVTIEDNRIVIHTEGPLELEFEKETKVFVNDKERNGLQIVTSKDNVRFECENIKAIRDLYIAIDNNKMEVKVSVHYLPETIISISCRKIAGRVKLVQKKKSGELPPLYTKEEIKLALKEKGVVFGFVEATLDMVSKEREVNNEIIAKGISVINDEEDRIDINFENTKRNVKEDSNEKIDYRNVYSIANIRKDEVLAELISGKSGRNGMNVFGMEIINKKKKNLKMQAKDGCIIDHDKVIATTEGRPTVKNGVFYVNKVFEAGHDVDMKSGNISFIGDVKITGSVKDGMMVEAGNGIDIGGNVENAKIIAQGEVHIKGNCLNANILVGAKDFSVQLYLTELTELKGILEELMKFYEDINKRNLLGADRSTGEIIKVLLETKFKDIQKKSMMILVNSECTMDNGNKLKRDLRGKLIGSAPLRIKYSSELYELIKCIDIEIEPLAIKLTIPVDVYLNYCQDTTVKATGDIFITGKGQYTSNLHANGNIDFKSSGAIARGGTLSAGKEIKAKTVGSIAGVTTLLKVPKTGVITADIAYQNSVFIFDERQYVLEIASKDIRAYIDEKGDIVVDRFLL